MANLWLSPLQEEAASCARYVAGLSPSPHSASRACCRHPLAMAYLKRGEGLVPSFLGGCFEPCERNPAPVSDPPSAEPGEA